MSQSTRKPHRGKAVQRPRKPTPDFPLTPHASGKWMKKIRGRILYFGRWAKLVDGKLVRVEGNGWQDALMEFKESEKRDHRPPPRRVDPSRLSVKVLCNEFLTDVQKRYEAGEIGPRMYKPGPQGRPELASGEYKVTTDRLVKEFGGHYLIEDLCGEDFRSLRAALAEQYGPVRLGNEIQKVRTVFRFGVNEGLITKPVVYGASFKKPSPLVMRRHRAAKGARTFTKEEIRGLIEASAIPLRAMILLGINAAFGPADCGKLPKSALDLDKAIVDFPRPKSGITRRAYLWPETIESLRAAIAARPVPTDPANTNLVFVTKYGRPWSSFGTSDAVTQETGKLLRKLKLHQPGRAFYSLRHTFRTIADATRDFPAVRLVMGHADGSVDDVYREWIDDDRLKVVSNHVRNWLFDAGGQS